MAKPLNRGTKDRPNWYCHIKHPDGKWKWVPSKQPTGEAARRWGIAKQAEIENAKVGILPQRAQSPDITVRQLIERSLAECHSPKVRKLAQNRTQRRSDLNQRIIPYGLARLSTQKVRAVDIERWRDALRKDGYAHASINATLTRLSTCFAWGIRQEIITGRNPCEGVERFPTKPRQDCYTLDEVHRLLALPDLLPMICSLPQNTPRKRLIYILKERWCTEAAYQESKGQLGMDQYQGRLYTGLQHHLSSVICTYAFIVAERERQERNGNPGRGLMVRTAEIPQRHSPTSVATPRKRIANAVTPWFLAAFPTRPRRRSTPASTDMAAPLANGTDG